MSMSKIQTISWDRDKPIKKIKKKNLKSDSKQIKDRGMKLKNKRTKKISKLEKIMKLNSKTT
jgi:hypothetical protein